jgi:hypothetical protein
MNEITAKKNICQGGSVKKSLLVAALAAVLVFAFASSALAVDHSGEMREGKSVVAGAKTTASPGVQVAGAGTYTYVDWSTALGTNSLSNSPHGAFTTTTVKCAVCHAIHYAAPSGDVVGGANSAADTLLRTQAKNACGYCHAMSGTAVNGTPVYNGQGYPATSGGSTTVGHTTGTNCSECHSSVHGSGADESVPAVVGYLLKTSGFNLVVGTSNVSNQIQTIEADAGNANIKAAGGNVTGFPYDAVTGWLEPATSDSAGDLSAKREEAVGIFCAECHSGSYAQTLSGATASEGSNDSLFTGHRVMATATATWTGHSTGAYNGKGQIAWADAASCKSCHDSKDQFGNAAFPHAWGNAAGTLASTTKMWLTMAPDAQSTHVDTGNQTTSYSYYGVGASQLQDGVCLKCHRSGAGSGVGQTF